MCLSHTKLQPHVAAIRGQTSMDVAKPKLSRYQYAYVKVSIYDPKGGAKLRALSLTTLEPSTTVNAVNRLREE
jgi:hypothetical protein